VTTITSLRLPFQIVENRHFQDLLRLAKTCPPPLVLSFPSGRTIQRHLQSIVEARQVDILTMLPKHAKLSIGLDCWTSPFKQAFMAITGYFLDQHWEYREVLLGFEPLEGTHSGENLALVLSAILKQHQIIDRIMAITTDNASNNSTMIAKIQKDYPDARFIRLPCMAHVIQLSLNQLLERIKGNPLNDTVDMVWTKERSKAARQRPKKRDIATTLTKARDLAIYINASPQRQEKFKDLQKTIRNPQLVPIQDVRTRWNSTYLMLQRAKRLQSELDRYCRLYDVDYMMLNSDEWRQIDYLLCLTKPFYIYTTALSKTKDVTIHNVFTLYNELFKHLEVSKRQLQRKRVCLILRLTLVSLSSYLC
jgi:hypothetical protein